MDVIGEITCLDRVGIYPDREFHLLRPQRDRFSKASQLSRTFELDSSREPGRAPVPGLDPRQGVERRRRFKGNLIALFESASGKAHLERLLVHNSKQSRS